MKKYIYVVLVLVLAALLTFQFYFDLQLRKTNTAFLVGIQNNQIESQKLEKFLISYFPKEVADFNSKNK